MDLSVIPIVDHHAHSLLKPEATADPANFRQWFTESTDPEIHAQHVPHSLFFRTGLRWLAELLNCEPTLDAFLAARAAQPYETWVRRLFNEANISLLLCDYGYQGADSYTHTELQAMLPLVDFSETLWAGRLGLHVYAQQMTPEQFAKDALEHEHILDAIDAGDEDTAERLTREHITHAQDVLAGRVGPDGRALSDAA